MDFRFLFDAERKLFRHRVPAEHALAGRVVLRSARLRGAAGQLHRHRQERRPGRPLVPPGPHADLRRGRAGAGVVEREHVRVSDAGAGHAVFPVHRAQPDLSGRGRPPHRLRRRARRALGRERERVQRARPASHLPVSPLRRARPRAQARPRARSRRRALCQRARDHGRTIKGAGQPEAAGDKGSAGALRLSRRARLHPPRPGRTPRSSAPTWPTTSAWRSSR